MNEARSTRWAWDFAFALVLVAVFAYATVTALTFPEGAKLFPLAIAVPSLLLAVLLVAISLRSRWIPAVVPTADAEADAEAPLAPQERLRRTAEIGVWFLGIFAAVYLLGFLVAIPIAAVAYLRLAARESWVTSVAIAGICWALVFGVFDRLLHVPLPAGELLRLFGLR
jgi:uncharacterized membrane protein